MNKILYVLGIITLLVLPGCGKETFSQSKMVPTCLSGEYAVPPGTNDQLKLQGAAYQMKQINVYESDRNCIATGILTKPTMVLGSEVNSIDAFKCQEDCISHDKNNGTARIFSDCCSSS